MSHFKITKATSQEQLVDSSNFKVSTTAMALVTVHPVEIFGKVDRFQDLSFSEWLAHTPPEAVMAHLHIDKATFDAIPKNGGVVMPLS